MKYFTLTMPAIELRYPRNLLMNICRKLVEQLRLPQFSQQFAGLTRVSPLTLFSVVALHAFTGALTTTTAGQETALIAVEQIADLPEVRLGKGYWSTPTAWRLLSSDSFELLHDGLGMPVPFFFVGGEIVLFHDNCVFERQIEDGRATNDRVLKLVIPPEAITRVPNSAGWAWTQGATETTPAAIYVSDTSPGKTDARTFVTLVGRPNRRGLGEVILRETQAHGVPFWRLEFTPNGKHLLSLGRAATFLWKIAPPNNVPLAEYVGSGHGTHNYYCIDRLIAVAPNSICFARAYPTMFGFMLTFYDTQTGDDLFQWQRSKNYNVQSVRFSPDSRKVFLFPYSTDADGPALIEFDVTTRTEKGYQVKDAARDGVFNGDTKNPILITRNRNGSVGFWNWKQRKQLVSLPLKSGDVQDIAVSPDGKVVAVATNEEIHFIEIVTQKRIGDRDYVHPKVKRIRFAEDNRHFASLGADGELRVWSLEFMGKPPEKIAPQYDGASF